MRDFAACVRAAAEYLAILPQGVKLPKWTVLFSIIKGGSTTQSQTRITPRLDICGMRLISTEIEINR